MNQREKEVKRGNLRTLLPFSHPSNPNIRRDGKVFENHEVPPG